MKQRLHRFIRVKIETNLVRKSLNLPTSALKYYKFQREKGILTFLRLNEENKFNFN